VSILADHPDEEVIVSIIKAVDGKLKRVDLYLIKRLFYYEKE